MSTSARGCLPRQQADYISKLAPEFGFCAHLYPGLFTCRAPSELGSVYIEIMKGGSNRRGSRKQAEAVQYFSHCIREHIDSHEA